MPNSHPAYISEFNFEENQNQLAKNARPKTNENHSGAVREGASLLQGIVICGFCGKMMSVRYTKSKSISQPVYYCDQDMLDHGKEVCQRAPGGNIDRCIEKLLLQVINPMTMEAATAIQQEMVERKEEVARLYGQQMERARYEMDLAKRRYLRVDPDNRLVAAELERDWNQKVGEYETAKIAYEQKCDARIRAVDNELKVALEELVSDFPKIWMDPQTSNREKKRIIRLVLDDVTITADSSKVILGVRFKGGATKIIEIPNSSRNLSLVEMEQDAVSIIKSLLTLGKTYTEIAKAINEKGITGFYGKPFNRATVDMLVQKYDLASIRDDAQPTGWLTSKEKMAELGVGRQKLRKMHNAGQLVYTISTVKGWSYLYEPEKQTKD